MKVCYFANNTITPEGPVSLPDGSWLFVETKMSNIMWISADGKQRKIVANTAAPNGLAVDAQGNIYVADAKQRALIQITTKGDRTILTTGTEQDPFMLPNDLCFGKDGMLYMTDSGMILGEYDPDDLHSMMTMSYDGKLYKIDPSNWECEVLDRGLKLTNGIAFDPTGSVLYVAETVTGNIYRYHVGEWERKFFANVNRLDTLGAGALVGPDGMAVDDEGNLYVGVVGQGDIVVLNPNGELIGNYHIDEGSPTNIAFSVSNPKTALITDAGRHRLYLAENSVNGSSLFYC